MKATAIFFYLLSLLSRFNLQFGSLVECLSDTLTNQWISCNLHGYHMLSSFQNLIYSWECTVKDNNELCGQVLASPGHRPAMLILESLSKVEMSLINAHFLYTCATNHTNHISLASFKCLLLQYYNKVLHLYNADSIRTY